MDKKLQAAVQSFWDSRTAKSVRAGKQLDAIETLIVDILVDAGLPRECIRTRSKLELPGYYRPAKKWDILAILDGNLIFAIEMKSMVGSVGKNVYNRLEEVIGSACDLWRAHEEDRFGRLAPPPFLGYLFLLEDDPAIHAARKNSEPNFDVDPIFWEADSDGKKLGVSYAKRLEILCRRLVQRRLCLLLTANTKPARVSEPAEDLSFRRFEAALRGQVLTVLGGLPPKA